MQGETVTDEGKKTVPVQFKYSGMDFEQVDREGRVALYRLTCPEWHHNTESFEIVLIQGDDDGNEWYPSGNLWGKAGWSITDLHKARALYRSKIKQYSK